MGRFKNMAQPVRNIIKEKHPELKEKSIYTLLIDGTNLLRISFKDNKVNPDGEHYGAIFQFLLQMKIMLKKKNFDYVYVVFDDDDSGILRWEIYNEYKANRDKHYESHYMEGKSDYWKAQNASVERMKKYFSSKKKTTKSINLLDTQSEEFLNENFKRERSILLDMLSNLYVRWFFDDKTEGDDIIAYYVLNKKPNEKVVIVSSDEDLSQLINDTVIIWNPRIKNFVTNENFISLKGYPHENVLIKKMLLGDDSDNIGKVDGLSEKKLIELIPEFNERPITINEVKERALLYNETRIKENKKTLKFCDNIINGVSKKKYDGDFYEIQEKLINLKKPLLTKEMKEEIDNTMYVPLDSEGRTFDNLYEIIQNNQMVELMGDRFSSFFMDFKRIIDIEKERFNDWLKQN